MNIECVTCGALVLEASEEKHEQWHWKLDEIAEAVAAFRSDAK